MSGAGDIPADVRSAANAAASNARVALFKLDTGAAKLWGAPGVIEAMNLHFARAIMVAKAEEREACAHAAFDAAKAARCGVLRARQIDAAIRNRGEVNTAHTFKNRED